MPRKAKSEGIVTDLPGVAAVSRALSILSIFENNDVKLSLAEIARRASMYKSTVSRLTESLEAYNMLSRDENGDYHLGIELIRLGAMARRSVDGYTNINATLCQLMEKTGESATYYVRRGNHRLALYRVDSPKSIRDHIRVGDLLPLDLGAAGRVLKLGSAAAKGRDPFKTILSLGERDSEVAAIAGPVYMGDAVTAALSVSGPITRFTDKNVASISRIVEQKCRYLSSLSAGE
jgi:DNA-binding IclR family transcriptional regulator